MNAAAPVVEPAPRAAGRRPPLLSQKK